MLSINCGFNAYLNGELSRGDLLELVEFEGYRGYIIEAGVLLLFK